MSIYVNGDLFSAMLDGGIRNLALHAKEVNDLNVFPVPDGDTGTNMVLTLRNGYTAVAMKSDLAESARAFSSAVVYGARGNSGVIISRFFRGFSDVLAGAGEEGADGALLICALNKGVEEAYRAVSRPTEGTMLTVLREATEKVSATGDELSGKDVRLLLKLFLEGARESLVKTPELLDVLKQAGVVDSGGAGVVYVFEGMYKQLMGEYIAPIDAVSEEKSVDYSLFNRQSRFEYGYCTEFLLQLLDGRATLDPEAFERYLTNVGDSVATTFMQDKVKVHVHTANPAEILAEAQKYGEFLSLKIENMSVQHTIEADEKQSQAESVEDGEPVATLCFADDQCEDGIGIVVCAPDRKTAELFFNMGADAALICPAGVAPTTKDFADAIESLGNGDAVIFANNKNFVLSASGVTELLPDSSVEVIATDSIAECYAALAMLDLDAEQAADMAEDARRAIEGLYTITVKQAVKDAVCDGISVTSGDYLALDAKGVVAADEELWELVKGRMNAYVEKNGEPDSITVFTGKKTPDGLADMIVNRVNRKYKFTDADVVETFGETYELIVSFE